MAATYKLYIDFDNDGIYEVSDDISDYVIAFSAFFGMGVIEPVAAEGGATLVLDNQDKRFSPSNTSSPYYDPDYKTKLLPRRGVRVTMDTGSGDTTIFTGIILDVSIDGGTCKSRRAIVRCGDNVSLIRGRRIGDRFELQENKRSDEVIRELLNVVSRGNWLVGIVGKSEVGVSTYVGGSIFSFDNLDVGDETFLYAGDTWDDDYTIWSALRDITISEGFPSRSWFNRSGDIVFWNRSHTQTLNETPTAITDADMLDMKYTWGGRIFNFIQYELNPRVDGTPGSVLFSNEADSIKIKSLESRDVRAIFTDSTGTRIGASTVTLPVTPTDFTANTDSDGSGTDYSSSIYVAMQDRGDSALVTLTNNAPVDIFIRGLQVRGTPLEHFDPSQFIVENAESQSLYGRMDTTVKATLLNDPDVAINSANYLLRIVSQPQELPELEIVGSDNTRLGYIENITIGDTIRLSESQTSINSSDFLVIGEDHNISNDLHTVRYRLEPLDSFRAWSIGISGLSEIGETTRIGF